MQLKANDLHAVFNDDSDLFKVFNAKGELVFQCEMQNRAVGGEDFGHWGRCPRGEFVLGVPVRTKSAPFGYWFTRVLDYDDNHKMRDFKREGIGIHGGGSGLPDPFAPRQGWKKTHGCLRVANEDNARIVEFVKAAQAKGGRVYLTVVGK
jgi:hypothetical protein